MKPSDVFRTLFCVQREFFSLLYTFGVVYVRGYPFFCLQVRVVVVLRLRISGMRIPTLFYVGLEKGEVIMEE